MDFIYLSILSILEFFIHVLRFERYFLIIDVCERHFDSVFEFEILFPPTTQLSQSILGMCLSEFTQIQLLYVTMLGVDKDMIRFFIVAINKTFLCRYDTLTIQEGEIVKNHTNS